MRLTRIFLTLLIAAAASPALRAEYVVLKSGQRLSVTGYQLLGDRYRLQVNGGVVEVPAESVLSIEPEEAFAPEPPKPVAASTAPYREIVEAAAARYNVDAELITSVIAAESNFEPKAVSRKNARGLMQLLPGTAAKLGVQNIFDPKENVEAGTKYLRELLSRYNNNLALALAAYNAGPERVQQYGSVPPYKETISYVRRVKQNYEKRKAEAPGKGSLLPGPDAAATSKQKTNAATP